MHKEKIEIEDRLIVGLDAIDDEVVKLERDFIAHEFVRRGFDHPNFCEDFTFTNSDSNLFFGAVFDGCSSGISTHFASTLFSKIFRRQLGMYDSLSSGMGKHFITGHLLSGAKEILYKVFQHMQVFKSSLDMDDLELLATILFVVHDKYTKETVVIAIGDGFISIDGEQTDIDQENVPDYLAYQLDHIHSKEAFVSWIDENAVIIHKESASDISICTDGITSFMKDPKKESEEDYDPIDFLTVNKQMIKNKAMFGRKCNMMKNKGKLYHMDDLSIVRIVNETSE